MFFILDKRKFIKENWGKHSIFELIESQNIAINEFLELAFELELYRKSTPNIGLGRRWTKEEDEFLKKYADYLSVREASNLLYRSRYATYQRVRFLGLSEKMIKKSKGR